MPPSESIGEQACAALTPGELTVRVDLARPELTGQLIAADQPPRAFHGWIELLTALDQALDAFRPRITEGPAETRAGRVATD